MTGPIVERVLRSVRYRDVEPALVERLAAEEVVRARNVDDAVKRVKRRLHQAVGAFRGRRDGDPLIGVREAWSGTLDDPALQSACARLMRGHASIAERVPFLDGFHAAIWARTGVPSSVLDVGCGLHPLALPWMGIGAAHYRATDVDRRVLGTVSEFLGLVGQPHAVHVADATGAPPSGAADVALLLKLVPTLDRQDPRAAHRLLAGLSCRHAVVSFPRQSLGGRGRGMDRTYRARLDRLVAQSERVTDVAEASVPNELVFVLTLSG